MFLVIVTLAELADVALALMLTLPERRRRVSEAGSVIEPMELEFELI